jgi:AraC family transcriptional activator of tynA and feaB
MTETLFAIDRHNVRDCQQLFRGKRDEEYYRGDYSVDDATVIDVRATRKSVGSSAIILLQSATRLTFRRTQKHIREDSTDLSVLWFVKHGHLVFTNQFGSRKVQPGDFLISRSMAPFVIECLPDSAGRHEVLHITVPTHILRSFVAGEANAGLFVSGQSRELAIAETMFTMLFDDGDTLIDDAMHTLFEAALALVGHGMIAQQSDTPSRQTITERRYFEVLRFIEVHLSDPGLSIAMVARGCGISPRYLSALLKQNNTSFSRLIWDQRLDAARQWINSSDPRDTSISEIAYGVGFKSPAHFSRMFKRTYLHNPSDYRAAMLPESARPMSPETARHCEQHAPAPRSALH